MMELSEVILISSLIFGGLVALVISFTISGSKVVKQEWNECNLLKERCNEVSAKTEIEELHRDMLTLSLKTTNPYIKTELMKIDSYLRGLYKNASKSN